MIANLRQTKRNHFFNGKLLGAEDLQLEQEYFRERLKRHNIYLHGFGVVFGLEVSRSGGQVVITPGLAVDCEGNEIVIAEPQKQSLPRTEDVGTTIFLNLNYVEKETDAVVIEGPNGSRKEYSRIEDSFAVVFERRNPNQGHRHLGGRWQACARPHGLSIARLRFTSGQWRIDRRHRRPVVK